MPIPILMYHQIDKAPKPGTPFRSLTVEPGDFRRQMKLLKLLGFRGLSMRDLKPYLSGEKKGKVVGITFDDGYRNVFEKALPTLQDLGFTATNYFVSRQTGGSNIWDAEVGIPNSPCMSKAEIREWAALGHEVGAHTLDHVHLTAVAAAEARRQIADCRKELEDLLGGTVDAFCYPYGEVSPEIRDMVQDAGYASATTTVRRRATPEDDAFLIPRRIASRKDNLLRFAWKCMVG